VIGRAWLVPKVRVRGFTLIEMIAVVAILSFLSLAVLPVAELTVKRSKERELKAALVQIRAALDGYHSAVDQGRIVVTPGASGYPASLANLVEGVEDAKDPARRSLYFLRRVPRDPFASPETPAELTWGLRSYASSAKDPQPGADVFDVYSRASDVGLNGVPYRDW
jgi:general secretion pathway protein G